eukprot:SAG31_NODE_1055_length_10134_cov_14.461837_4_plen_153_part_00
MQYSQPLTMILEPENDTIPFLETVTDNLMMDGSNLCTRHKLRPWTGASYRICRLGVAGTADIQVSSATATFMRIIDNSTYDDGAAYSIAMEMQEMVCGAGWSKSKTWAAFLRLTRRRVHVEKSCRYIQFYRRHWQAVALYFDSLLLSSFSGD